MYMKDWIEKLDAFLEFNEEDILRNKGKVSQKVAKKLDEQEFDKFKVIREKNYQNDFDRYLSHKQK